MCGLGNLNKQIMIFFEMECDCLRFLIMTVCWLLLLKHCRCRVSVSFEQSVSLQPSSSAAASKRDVSFTIFDQCITFTVNDMLGEVGNDFQPCPSLFHKYYSSETEFNDAFFNHINPTTSKISGLL